MKNIFSFHQPFSLLILTSAFCLASLVAFAGTVQPQAAAAQQYNFRLTYSDAEQAIGQALAEKGAGTKVAATITGNRSTDLFSYDKPITVEIRGLQFERPIGHWSASMLFVSETGVISALPIAGHYEEINELPVLKHVMRGGEIIGENDVELRDFPVSRTRADSVTDIAHLVGKTPLRVVSPSRPVRESEVITPIVIKKNSMVQMRYTTPGMEITTSGQALAEGSKGDVIAVRNLASKKIIRAVVEDQGMVTVVAAGAQVSQKTGVENHETN